MKSKCSFILKASTALVLALLMLFGTVATSVAAVVENTAASSDKAADEAVEDAAVETTEEPAADIAEEEMSGEAIETVFDKLKKQLSELSSADADDGAPAPKKKKVDLAATGLDSGDGIHLGIGTTTPTWHGMGNDAYEFTLQSAATIYYTFSVGGGNFGRGNQGNPGSDSPETNTYYAIKDNNTQFSISLPAGTYSFKLKGIQSGNVNCLEYQFWQVSSGGGGGDEPTPTPSGDKTEVTSADLVAILKGTKIQFYYGLEVDNTNVYLHDDNKNDLTTESLTTYNKCKGGVATVPATNYSATGNYYISNDSTWQGDKINSVSPGELYCIWKWHEFHGGDTCSTSLSFGTSNDTVKYGATSSSLSATATGSTSHGNTDEVKYYIEIGTKVYEFDPDDLPELEPGTYNIYVGTTDGKLYIASSTVGSLTVLPKLATSLSISASPTELTAVDQTSTITVTATNIASGVTNLTYTIYDRANNQPVGNAVTVTNGATSATFTVTPNARVKSYFASVKATSSAQQALYDEVWTASDATISNSADAYIPRYTVTFSSNNDSYGTVTAKDGSGTVLTSPAQVKEGDTVTFTATAKSSNEFTGWSQFETKSSAVTRVIRADTTATGNFGPKGYKVLAGSDSTNDMKELSNGTYISTVTYNHGAWFEIVRNATGKTTVASADHQGVTTGTKYKVTSWQDGTTWRGNYIFKIYDNIGDGYYIVYDPATEEVWLTKDPDDLYAVTVVAKDGTIRYGYQNLNDYTQVFGDTTVELVSPASIDGTVDNNAYGGMAVAYNLSADDVRNGVTLKIKTQTKSTYVSQGYYVKGFVVSGYEKSFSVLWPDDNAADAAKVEAGYNEFELTLPSYPDKKIEITPVYWVQEATSGDNVRFYVESFAGDVYKEWGGSLAVNAYGTNGPILGEYPGQPMINYNGRYVVDIPRDGLQGITLNNYVWDRVHSNLFIGTDGIDNPTTSNGYLQKIQGANKQTYDFNDFIKIKQTLEHDSDPDNNDEDIIFSFRYKYNESYNTPETSNHGKLTYYKDSDAQGKEPVVTVDTTYDYEDQANTLDPGLSIYQWENLTDLYKNRVDILGDKIDTTDVEGHSTNPKAAYTNPVRIVSNGYDFSEAGKYATAWAVYVPVDSNNQLAPDGAYDHYQLVEVFGGQGKVKKVGNEWIGRWGSSSYLVDYNHFASLRDKYDYAYYTDTSIQHSGSSFVYDLAKMPTVITYEYSVNSNKSNLNLEEAGSQATDGNPGLRTDGRWYASSSKQFLKAHTIIEYAEKDQENLYHRDFYQAGGIDFNNESSYNKTINVGLATGIKAYFGNEDSDDGVYSQTGVAYQNTAGHTEAYSVSDGEHKFSLRTVGDPNGEYSFKGWYMYTNGVYTHVSDDPSYESEATANDVYVARYYKTPSGKVTISHVKSSDSTGSGDCKATISIVNSAHTNTVATLITDTLESFTVGSKYIKYNSEDHIKIVLKTEPDENSRFDTTYGFHENIGGTNTQFTSTLSEITGSTATVNTANQTATIYIPIASLFTDEEQTIKGLPFLSKIIGLGTYQFVYKDRNNEDTVYNVKVDLNADEVAGYAGNGNKANVPTYDWTGSKAKEWYPSKNPVETALEQIESKIGSYKREINWDLSSASSFTADEKTRTVRVTAVCPVEQFTFKYTLNGDSEKTYAKLVTYTKIVTFNESYKGNSEYHYIEQSIPRSITVNGKEEPFSYWSSDAAGNKPLTTNITFGMLITDGVNESAEHDVVHVYAQYGKFAPEAPQWQPNFEEIKQTRKIENDRGDTVDTKYLDYLVNYVNKDDKRIQNLVGDYSGDDKVAEYGIVVLKGDIDYEGTGNDAMSNLVDKMITRNLSQAKKTWNSKTFIAYRFAYNDVAHTSSFNRTLYTISGNNSVFVNKHFTAMAYIKTTSGSTFYTPVDCQSVAADA